MALDDLLKVIPQHERERLQSASTSQRELLSFYAQAHEDIVRILTDEFLPQLLRGGVPVKTLFSAARQQELRRFIEARVSVLNSAVGSALRTSASSLADMVTAQVATEAKTMGIDVPAFGRPDVGVLEKQLEDAVSRIGRWNSQLAPDIISNIRMGLLRGESYREISQRVATSSALKGQSAPIQRARTHMLVNTRYAVVDAANAARQDAYKDIQKNNGIKVQKMWWAAIGTCCVSCARLHGTIVDQSDQFPWEDLNLKIVPFRKVLWHPPLHPNCRCRILPVTADLLSTIDRSAIGRESKMRIDALAKVGVG